jgi:hypothetical protein
MPKLPTNYQKIVLYKVQHKEKEDLIAFNYTTEYTKRKYNHKHGRTNTPTDWLLRENGGFDAFTMVQVAKFPCGDKYEAEAECDRLMRTYERK